MHCLHTSLKLSKKFDNKKFEGIIEKDKNSDKYFISRSEDESEADYEAKVWGILNNNNLKMCYDWQSRVYSNTNIPANEKPGQLTGHVYKFKKVLYTNGLEFYYLKLVDNQIEVECLADLTDYFYKMNEKSWTMLADEWAKLIKELAKIDWYEDPTVKIENT